MVEHQQQDVTVINKSVNLLYLTVFLIKFNDDCNNILIGIGSLYPINYSKYYRIGSLCPINFYNVYYSILIGFGSLYPNILLQYIL